MTETFSIIIVNYRTFDLTDRCLQSIFRFLAAGRPEVILVDSHSGDGSGEKLREKYGNRIKFVVADKNRGFAVANNLGAAVAHGDYLFFLNSDTLLKSDILPILAGRFAADQKIGILAPRLLRDGTDQPYAYSRNSSGGLGWVSGAALAIPRPLFKKIGGWDENYFMYFEDVDLCRRVRQAGYRLEICQEIAINHLGSGSPLPFWRRKLRYYRSKIYFFFKFL